MPANSPDVTPISFGDTEHLGVHRRTHELYWDGVPVVTRSKVQIGTFERWMTGLIAAGNLRDLPGRAVEHCGH